MLDHIESLGYFAILQTIRHQPDNIFLTTRQQRQPFCIMELKWFCVDDGVDEVLDICVTGPDLSLVNCLYAFRERFQGMAAVKKTTSAFTKRADHAFRRGGSIRLKERQRKAATYMSATELNMWAADSSIRITWDQQESTDLIGIGICFGTRWANSLPGKTISRPERLNHFMGLIIGGSPPRRSRAMSGIFPVCSVKTALKLVHCVASKIYGIQHHIDGLASSRRVR